jgi:hypothetical protein
MIDDVLIPLQIVPAAVWATIAVAAVAGVWLARGLATRRQRQQARDEERRWVEQVWMQRREICLGAKQEVDAAMALLPAIPGTAETMATLAALGDRLVRLSGMEPIPGNAIFERAGPVRALISSALMEIRSGIGVIGSLDDSEGDMRSMVETVDSGIDELKGLMRGVPPGDERVSFNGTLATMLESRAEFERQRALRADETRRYRQESSREIQAEFVAIDQRLRDAEASVGKEGEPAKGTAGT